MNTATTDDVRSSLTELLVRIQIEPVIIRDGNEDVAVLVSRAEYERDHLLRVTAFERSRDAMVLELESNLAANHLRLTGFVEDLLK